MKKPLFGLLLAVFALPLLAPLGACSSEPGPAASHAGDAAADAKPRRDAGKDTGVPSVGDASSCVFGPIEVTDPATSAVAAQPGACRHEDVAAGKGACLGASATQAKCDAFKAANATCAGCLGIGTINKDAAGKALLPALVPFGDSSVIPNTDACAAVVLENAATCGFAYIHETECLLTGCGFSCPANECVQQAETACAPFFVAETSCGKALKERSAEVDAGCTGTQFDDTFAKVAAVLCE